MNKKSLLIVLFLSFFTIMYAQDIMMRTGMVDNIDETVTRHFYDGGGLNGEYAPNMHDTLILCSNLGPTSYVLYVNFEEFAVGYHDTLFIYDGNSTDAPLIGAYTLVSTPGNFTSTGKCLTFVFATDNVQDIGGLSDGWKASVISYNLQAENILMSAGNDYVTFYTCNANFYDDGGPTGNISGPQTRRVVFNSGIGEHLRLEFNQSTFNIGSGNMEIYDGDLVANPLARKIGTFNSTNKPPVLFSSGFALTVLLTISAPTSAPGWAATISCVPDIFNPEDGTACPEVSVGQVINGTITKIDTVQFSCDNPIVMLEANYVATGQYTNDYMVYSIPFGSPFAFNSGTSISATADDNWVTAVPLPFNFSFFGQIYTTAYPGANGLISLSPQPSGSFCKFSYIPTAIPKYNYQNCIYGVYEDIDPRYYLNPAVDDIRMDVLGTSPCRAFVFNYLNVGLFGKQGQGNDWYNTYQMVMYEGTNIIEVHIKHRKCCASTNGGSTNGTNEGIVGLQNLSGSQEVIAPGRGMTGWEVLGTNYEAWRFVPITPLDEQGELTWYENTVSPATALGHNKKLPVSPDTTTRYIAEYTFTNAAGDEFQLLDTVLVVVDIPSIIVVNSANGEICPGDSVYLDVNCQEANRIVSYEWSSGATESRCLVKPDVSTNYTVMVTFDNRCTATMSSSVTIKPLEYPQITGDSVVCQGHPVTLNAVTIDGISYQWNTGAVTSTIHVTPFDTTEYTVTSTLQNGCTTSSTYVVNVWANPMASFIPDPPLVYVENGVGTVNFNDNSMDAITWHWNFGDQYSLDNTSMLPSPSHIYTHPGFFNVVQTVKNENGCVDSVSYRITVEVPFFYYIPNAFTPNNDGVNDVFAPKGEGVDPDKFEMTLYDRFGKLMFRTRTPYDYWDGKTSTGQLCPLGAYVYVINFTTLDGEVKEYTGTVTLVR